MIFQIKREDKMIFVDSSAFIPLVVPSDKFCSKALKWWRDNTGQVELTTSNLIIVETLGWIRHKIGKKIAVETGQNILYGGDINIKQVTANDEKKAWQLFQKLDGRGVSMIDCTSFVLMKRLKIKQVFAFDSDFESQGFIVLPN